jgi:hypothetical protein
MLWDKAVDSRPSRKCDVHALRGGAVKVRSAAERGVGAQRRGLDGAEHSATLTEVMAARHARGHDVVQITGLALGQGGVTPNARSDCKIRSPSARRSLTPDAAHDARSRPAEHTAPTHKLVA